MISMDFPVLLRYRKLAYLLLIIIFEIRISALLKLNCDALARTILI